MPLFYAPATYAGGAGSLLVVGGNLHSHRLDQHPVHTVGPPIQLIVQVISPVTDSQMGRVNTAPVMTPMANHLITIGGEAVDYAVPRHYLRIIRIAISAVPKEAPTLKSRSGGLGASDLALSQPRALHAGFLSVPPKQFIRFWRVLIIFKVILPSPDKEIPMRIDSAFMADTDEPVDVRTYLYGNDETSKIADDPVGFRSRLVASWFVRSQNNFYCVSALGARLTQRDVKRISLTRFRNLFPDAEKNEEVWREVFQRVIEETHDDPEQTIPIWNGKSRCLPGHSKPVILDGEMVSINTWSTPAYRELGVEGEDFGMFDAFLDKIFSQGVDRGVFKDWLSWSLQNEADKPAWAPFFYSRRKGTGKSTLCQLVVALFGEKNSLTQNSIEKLTGRFNKPILDSKLVVSEELRLRPDSTQGNTLKTYISETVITSEAKGQELERVEQYCCCLFTSNHLPLWMEADERRYYVIHVDHDGCASGPKAEEFGAFVASLKEWMSKPENIARLYNALLVHRQSNTFNPYALNLSSIDTPVMQQIMGSSREVTLVRLEEWLAESKIYHISLNALSSVFSDTLKINPSRIRHMMPEIGWRQEKAKWGGVDHARVLWVHPDFHVAGGRVKGPDGYDEPVEPREVLE